MYVESWDNDGDDYYPESSEAAVLIDEIDAIFAHDNPMRYMKDCYGRPARDPEHMSYKEKIALGFLGGIAVIGGITMIDQVAQIVNSFRYFH